MPGNDNLKDIKNVDLTYVYNGNYVRRQVPPHLQFNRDRSIKTFYLIFFLTFLRAYFLTSFSDILL